ncbi:NAD-dependent protein deacylase [Clostridiales bacterium COT073_COT-073]|nr:NAD-dependent protein deacylase [Clostridiales bacterium COT073_COT-073]
MHKELKEIIESSNNIVFFGGAGVSTESNIPDFRSATGLYNQKNQTTYSVEEVLSHGYYVHHRKEFFDFYKHHLVFPEAKPNAAHIALAKLEERGKLKAVITQNVDGLHQAAGSKNVLELHGSVHRNYCESCGERYGLDFVLAAADIPTCPKCGGVVRPDVVLYGEGLDMNVMERAVRYIAAADVLIIGGTSLVVYPAAGLVSYFRGQKLVLINRDATSQDTKADLVIREKIGEVLG